MGCWKHEEEELLYRCIEPYQQGKIETKTLERLFGRQIENIQTKAKTLGLDLRKKSNNIDYDLLRDLEQKGILQSDIINTPTTKQKKMKAAIL